MTILIGTEGDDRLFGGDDDDSLYGLGGADLLRGLDGDDWLEGSDGDDNLYGGAGADTLTGGAGVDILNYGDSAAGVSVNLTTSVTHGGAAEGDVLLDSFEIVRGSLFDDTLIGDANDNALRGLAGDDVLRGLAGADILNGGDGEDLLDGGDADDILRGGRGGDSLIGGAGRDLVSYAYSDAGVTIDLAAGTAHGGFAEGDQFLDRVKILDGSLFADSLAGSAEADALNGLDGDDALDGGAGDDVLDGGAGADSLTGGVGTDTVDYAHSQAGIAIDLAAGTAHGGDADGDSFGDAIEVLRGSRFADTLTGDAGDNILFGAIGTDTLSGGDGDDVLDGGAGADSLDGGAGIDLVSYADSPVGPTINLTTGVSTGGDAEGDVLSGIEIIEGSRLRGIDVTGDDGVNILRGLGAINSFNGLGGDDIATGADYADYFYGGDGNDALDGGAYHDGLQGGAGDDTLIGGAGNDDLHGDDLYDATGADRFLYTSLADTTVTSDANFREKIHDFSQAEGDVMDLGAIDADGDTANGDTAFTIVTGAFTGAGAELLITPVGTGRSALVRADVDGDTRTDFLVQIFVDVPLTAADFVL
ncbi:Ca2+-binding RTX toxin-like protein [Inquilinus ginsengisoli]|uniref:calcium-binding protein n=1 Tax=Inquilinus ginsengisoli TaxID=363840 RepID=UPI003D1DD7F2